MMKREASHNKTRAIILSYVLIVRPTSYKRLAVICLKRSPEYTVYEMARTGGEKDRRRGTWTMEMSGRRMDLFFIITSNV